MKNDNKPLGQPAPHQMQQPMPQQMQHAPHEKHPENGKPGDMKDKKRKKRKKHIAGKIILLLLFIIAILFLLLFFGDKFGLGGGGLNGVADFFGIETGTGENSPTQGTQPSDNQGDTTGDITATPENTAAPSATVAPTATPAADANNTYTIHANQDGIYIGDATETTGLSELESFIDGLPDNTTIILKNDGSITISEYSDILSILMNKTNIILKEEY